MSTCFIERHGHCDAFSAVKMNSTDEMDRKFMLVAAHFLKLKFGIAKNLSPSPCKAKLEKSCFLVGQHCYICNGFGYFVVEATMPILADFQNT